MYLRGGCLVPVEIVINTAKSVINDTYVKYYFNLESLYFSNS
jgi:hypothetical protein